MKAIMDCFDHILNDHQTKGHATLIAAAMLEIKNMEAEVLKLRTEVKSLHEIKNLSKQYLMCEGFHAFEILDNLADEIRKYDDSKTKT